MVIGAPNIQDFAPSDNSIIHIPNEEVMILNLGSSYALPLTSHSLSVCLSISQALPAVAARMHYLMGNDSAYDEMLRWKVDGPSDQFLALIDIGTVHPECRLCQFLADRSRRGEKNKASDRLARRPCACRDPATGLQTHHLFVRERHTLEHRSLFLEEPLSVGRLQAAVLELYGPQHRPVWSRARPSYRRKHANGSWDLGHVQLRVHRLYPSGLTQREALYGRAPDPFTVRDNATMDRSLAQWVADNPCGELDVIFV